MSFGVFAAAVPFFARLVCFLPELFIMFLGFGRKMHGLLMTWRWSPKPWNSWFLLVSKCELPSFPSWTALQVCHTVRNFNSDVAYFFDGLKEGKSSRFNHHVQQASRGLRSSAFYGSPGGSAASPASPSLGTKLHSLPPVLVKNSQEKVPANGAFMTHMLLVK